ncbi:hypothetical protein ACJX0J_012796, partial [Zea mays]
MELEPDILALNPEFSKFNMARLTWAQDTIILFIITHRHLRSQNVFPVVFPEDLHHHLRIFLTRLREHKLYAKRTIWILLKGLWMNLSKRKNQILEDMLRACKKLAPRYVGPYQIIERKGEIGSDLTFTKKWLVGHYANVCPKSHKIEVTILGR